MKATTAGRLTGVLRVGLGTAHVIAPGPISAPLVGSDAASPGAQVFIRAFGLRDALLGLAVARAGTDKDLRRWLGLVAVVDLVDTVGVLTVFSDLPARRRWAAVIAPGAPALLGAVLVAAIGRGEPVG